MDLIARLRPRWRHPDPIVRAGAVREMAGDDQDRLGAIAGTDPDPHVRRIAIKKLEDAAILERVAEGEADPVLRDLALERASEARFRIASSDRPLDERTAAVERLTDPRRLVTVATSATHESVRLAALSRVSGDRHLREIVRNATDPAIGRAALDRIQDASMLCNIALADGPVDLALRALERIDDTASLQAIAGNRTPSKTVRQRAQALLAARTAEGPAVGVKEARARQLELLTLVHTLRSLPDVIRAADRAREAQREWDELARDAEPRPEVAEPFAAACDEILRNAGSLTRRRAEADEARLAFEGTVAAHAALCERVDAIDGPDAPQALAGVRADWDRLEPVPGGAGAALSRRFAQACERCTERHRRWLAAEAQRAELERIVGELEALADDDAPLPSAQAWKTLEGRWTAREAVENASAEIEALDRRFAAANERVLQRRQQAEQHRARLEHENRQRLEALCSRLEQMAQAPELKPSAGRREVQAADAALGDLDPLPPSERRATWSARLQQARDQLLRRISEVEQTEEWRRWANASAQEEIIVRVEALLETNDLAEGLRQLGGLQDEWKQVATTTPDKSQALWERFRTARNELRRRCDAYLASNLQKKRALCAEAAELADSTSWNETSEHIRRLQAAWKEIGPVPGRHTAALWRQFRDPCDRFFTRRKEHFDRLDESRRDAAQRKEALCVQAEALADSTDWETAAAAIKQLQAEWKTSGVPPRAQADALWKRFRTACDRFFDRRSRRGELAREEALGRVRSICDELETLVTSLGGEDAPESDRIGQKVDEAWGAWLHLDIEPGDDTRGVVDRLQSACGRIAELRPESLRGTRLDPDVTRKRREKLCARLESLLAADNETPRTASLQEMALALRERLAANTIGGGADRDPRSRQDVERELERTGASWASLGPVLDDQSRLLADRFERARDRLRTQAK